MTKNSLMIAALLSLAGPVATPVLAQNNGPVLYETGGKRYNSLAECQRAKKRAKDRATVAGAAIAGAGAALLGGNLGETALVAGAGALAGREIGRRTVKQC
ncbi:hypothetical protein [Sandarakinorhabdus rubra]|uniref:hypothetical protein n=1 Tax=Sandarakinorhabdus rubra TaxID=2672568 RepID=UPI0013DB5D99|nr:hypothetical protein [Sandarakinorhabdus rubra]